MKTRVFCAALAATVALLGAEMLSAQTISGTLDSRLVLGAGAGDAPAFSWGLEELANIRFQARLRDRAVFHAAVNLAAAAGSTAVAANAAAAVTGAAMAASGITSIAASSYIAGTNYIGAIELERLYFRLPGDTLQFDFGLLRIPFGYSLVWGSSDFLNPRDPLSTNARARGVPGGVFAAYPDSDTKLTVFAAAPHNPFARTGAGLRFGAAAEHHWSKASVQGLYSYETPDEAAALWGASPWGASPWGVHRLGFSLKADVEIGLVAEALFTWNPDGLFTVDGLSAGAGFDYNLFGGRLYLLAEYLFNGKASSTAALLGLRAYHLLQVLFRYSIDDYTSLALSCTASFDDLSFLPALTFSTGISQGMTLTLAAQVPLDRYVFSGSAEERGQLGPLPPALDVLPPGSREGSRFSFSAALRIKF